ncbi:MAG: hypothetical protein AMS27_13450 [Bacteroides sp. SM23_62_1]|nr:MAG: hypothetical protein AMS27_13450 [Bacteroides sp. SM23_62_1]
MLHSVNNKLALAECSIHHENKDFYIMEDLIPFNQSIELSPDTKKLMLGMIQNMQSLMPSGPVLVPEDIPEHNFSFMHAYAAEVLKLSHENDNIFDGIIDPEFLEKYISNTYDLKELADQLEQLLKSIRKYQHLSDYLSYRLACMMKDHLEMIKPEICKSLNHDLIGKNNELNTKRSFKQASGKLKIV